ncbi:MAG TPA: HypC/HybG/HupF family hydrogenase formation chaperone [Acidimicrobiales bacterium]|nr:HypC/HybG/HupF family hydrogenase formation chaperone [Acidimicrobiales bacterium]
MCESTLCRVEEVLDAGRVLARRLDGSARVVSLLAFESATPAVGDWMVVHSGYALERVGEEEALAAIGELAAVGSPVLVLRPSRGEGEEQGR